MGKRLIILLLMLPPAFASAQRNLYFEEWNPAQLDSIRHIWNADSSDTLKMAAARTLGIHQSSR